MNWDTGTPVLSAHDFSNFQHHWHSEQTSVAIRKLGSDEPVSVEELMGSKRWEAWLSDATAPGIGSCEVDRSGLYVIQCGRAPEVFPGQASPVSHLPFERSTWRSIANVFHVHPSITRTIARRVAFFSTVRYTSPDSELRTISYTYRMSAALPDDLALSTTYIPHMRKVYCVIFGCNSAQMQAVEKRIRAAGDGTDHPLLVTGILAEIERERLINMAEDLVDQFTLGSDVLETKSWDPNSPKLQHYLAICFQSGGLADQIRAVKRQIVKLIAEVETLEREWTGNHDSTNYCQRSGNFILEQQPLLDTGQRIKQRLQDIMNEYDDKIDECKMMAHNLSLAMQSASNKNARQDSVTNIRIAKANTIIALETKRESAQMRSIALLTMIYLPMSCVASIFSTSLFNWRPDEGEAVVSHYIWVLLVLSVGLTVITVLAWHFTTNREKKRENKRSQSFDINLEDMV